jgi:hypothetical protein
MIERQHFLTATDGLRIRRSPRHISRLTWADSLSPSFAAQKQLAPKLLPAHPVEPGKAGEILQKPRSEHIYMVGRVGLEPTTDGL